LNARLKQRKRPGRTPAETAGKTGQLKHAATGFGSPQVQKRYYRNIANRFDKLKL
jgi:hypothetical protein